MIKYNEIKSLQNKEVYPTSNEKYILAKRSERIVRSPEYKILGFLHNFSFSYDHTYIAKNTLDGICIFKRYIGNIEYGAFNENVNFMYLYKDKKFYKVDENLNIEWEESTDDYIRSITVDTNGHAFIVYKNSRIIHEYLPDKTKLRSFRDSDDVTNKTRIYKTFVNKGRTEMYAIGTIFVKIDEPYIPKTKPVGIYVKGENFLLDHNGNPIIINILADQINATYMSIYADTFIDKYDLITGKREKHGIVSREYGISSTDPYYNYDNIYVKGNNIYIYSNEYIQKINKNMTNIWKYHLAYNQETNRYNQLAHIEYDDNEYDDYIYFVEDLYETNGHGFGKLNTKGNLIWKISFDKSIDNIYFSFAAYKNDIFTSHKSMINIIDSYTLAVNDYNILFKTKDNKLIKIIRNNEDEIYSNDYYDSFSLLADVIKDDIPEYIIKPLITNNKPLLTEDDIPIVIEKYNENYLNPENYDTYALQGIEVRDKPYPNAGIVTKDQRLVIITRTGDIITTLKPVKPPAIKPSYMFGIAGIGIAPVDKARIIDKYYRSLYIPGIGVACIDKAKLITKLTDNIDDDIFEYPFYIDADRHIFRNNIVTKKKSLTIITKRTGASIIKKKKDFYKFIYRRFSDVDIVLEFIKQSGILKTRLPHFADRLIHHTTHMIEDMQEAHVPVAYNLKAQKMFEYWFDCWEIPIRELKTQVYLCHNLPYMRKQDSDSIYIDSMANLVNKEMIKPFIMFIDGKAIKWSNMTIVKNWEYSYIIVSNIDHDTSYKYKVDAILLPCLVRYGEDENILPIEYERFLFDEFGKYTDTPSSNGIRVEIIDPKVKGNTFKYTNRTRYIQLEAEYNQISSDKNILIFENDKFNPDNVDYLYNHGENIYTYDGNKTAIMKTFYFIKANSSKCHLVKIPHQTQVEKDIADNIKNSKLNGYLNNFRNEFDYSYKFKYSYNENVSRAIEYIMGYDMSLLNKYYIDKSNVRCYCYSGKDILEKAKNNYLEMPRTRKYGLDDYVVVFKNGNLYERYREIEYKANMFRIPVNRSLEDDDTLEIVHFKHVDNRYYSTRLTHMSPAEQKLFESASFIDYSKIDFARLYENNWYYTKLDNENLPAYDYKDYLVRHLRHGHLTIWGNNKSGDKIYDDYIKPDNYIQYPVEFDYKNYKDEYGNYTDTEIILKDRYYKYKMLNFTSNRQFHSMYYNVLEDKQDMFNLDQLFRFCHNKKQYMVFVNGKKLNFNEFDLMIPRLDKVTIYTIRALDDGYGNTILINDKPIEVQNTLSTVRWDKTDIMCIKTATPLKLGDIIDIIYVPDPYDEIILNNYMPNENGVIELDRNILQYPFSKELFLIFMNGKKVPNDLIYDVNMNKIRIKNMSDNDRLKGNNITICKYIVPDEILKEVYSYGDEWSSAVDKLSDSDFHKLFVELKKLV